MQNCSFDGDSTSDQRADSVHAVALGPRDSGMSMSAGEPNAAGVGLIVIGAASGMALFSAFGGSLIGAGISIALLQGQLLSRASQVRRFLVSVASGPVITLATLELTNWRIGAYTISAMAMLISFLAWKGFTSLHHRSAKIIDAGLDKALGKTLGIDCDDELTGMDGEHVDSGRADNRRAGSELAPTRHEQADKGSSDGR